MKIADNYTWIPRTSKPLTIEDALAMLCDSSSYDGYVERLEGTIVTQQHILIKLISILTENKLLTNADVQTLLGSRFKVEDANPNLET